MIGLIIAGAALLAAIIVAIIKWDAIVSWFNNHDKLTQEDLDNVGFDLTRMMADGKYESIHGVLNRKSGKVLDGEKFSSNKMDAKTKDIHKNEELVILT